ncbi:hypothetical protein BV25DRAFT_1556959 [Artomyces pyxidatus]|uniref:Uncharacterized protein n=1 Tax=Artomyces pyxidatus TaxID=48021 RepID=A0ACB8SL12_9AGAM|nr:hypothetical protein BV25DRAFT_1556959 [Artomyces pyxidatus]
MSQDPSKSQYAAASHVPFIKSPSLRMPRPVEMPPDIHPLPESVTPYFVYPFTIEQHVITLESSRRQTLAAHAARREAYLRARADEQARRRREALRRIAPGFEPQGTPLVPLRAASLGVGDRTPEQGPPEVVHQRDVMDDLVDGLAALESASMGNR